MICKNCGSNIPNDQSLCTVCGASISPAQVRQSPPPRDIPINNSQPYYQPHAQENSEYIPNKYRPVKPASISQFIGWYVILMIPLVGFILAIVFAVDDSDMNRANFFRAYLIRLAFIIGLTVLLGIIVTCFTV